MKIDLYKERHSMMNKETMKQAGYIKHEYDAKRKLHILTDIDGKKELWFSHKYYAGYGIIYKNTHLEFMCDYKEGTI